MQTGEEEVDFTSPDYILQNIQYEDNFETFENFSASMRARVIQNICDQVCFYIACILKSFTECERPPTIWIYGAGYLGSSVIESLCDCGCKPMLKIFARDEMVIKSWKERGIKAVKRLNEGQFIDIMIICSNLASFSQFCRDVSDFVSPKTCIITTVFGLQRCRLFNILRTPGIFRTFVERDAPLYDIEDVADVAVPPSPSGSTSPPSSRMSMSPPSAVLSPYSRQSAKVPKWAPSPLSPMSKSKLIQPSVPKKTPLTPMEVSARFLASRKNAVRNLIVLLENYYIISGMPATQARAMALSSVVGTEAVQSVERPTSAMGIPSGCPALGERGMGKGDEESASLHSESTGQSAQPRECCPDLLQSESGLSQASLLIQGALKNLEDKYCRHFQVELSKHILVLDMPRINDSSMDFAGSPLGRGRKKLRNRINRQPTRGVVGTPLSNWELRFLSDAKLIDIFKLDSKSAYINDTRNSFLEELAMQSDDDEDGMDSKKNESEGGADKAPGPVAAANMERFYILRYDSSNFSANPPMSLPSLGKPSFFNVIGDRVSS